MNQKQAKRNIWLLLLLRFLTGSLVSMPVIVLFWQQNGLSQAQIFWTQAAFAAAVLLMEVPSGWLADRFKRKYSLMLGFGLTVIGFAFYAISGDFWSFVAAEVLLGIGISFISGADSALAYDSLLAAGNESRYRQYESRAMMLASIGTVLASLAGGLIAAEQGLRATLMWQLPLQISALVVAAILVEPSRHKHRERRNPMTDVLTIVKHSLHGHKEIKWLIIFGAVIATTTHTVLWLYQPYYQQQGVPVAWFGVLAAAQYVAVAVFAPLADRFERLGRKLVLCSLVAISVVSYLAMGIYPSLLAIAAQLGFHFTRAVSDPILKDYVNRLVESEVRATVLSVKSLVQRIIYIGAGPLIGYIMDLYSLQTALLFSAILYGTLGVIALVAMWRAKLLG